jgi:hypothetical protein
MISYGKQSLGVTRRRPLQLEGGTFHKSEWMDSGEAPGIAPTMFLVEQPPNCSLEPHFHTRNQFQLFVAGQGRLGPQELALVMVHYAGAFTGYGPLVSGSEGLKYFTIRAQFESGFIPAAQAREKMIRGPKRHAQAVVGEPLTSTALAALAQLDCKDIIQPDAGLGVRRLRLPASTYCDVSHITGSSGFFLVILAGVAQVAGIKLQPWESAFVPFADGVQQVQAAEGGTELVVLHVPDEAPEYAGSRVTAGGGDRTWNVSKAT